MDIRFETAEPADLERLVALRIASMRESLERVGRFDPARAAERFASTFEPSRTQHVVFADQRVGVFVLKPHDDGLLLDHLYIAPSWQGRGIGSAILKHIFAQADAQGVAVRVGVLLHSDANRFYRRHGFELVATAAFDNYYLRAPRV